MHTNGVMEASGSHGGRAIRIYKPCLSAHIPQRRLEQVACAEKLAVMHEQSTAQPPRQLVQQPPCRLAHSVKLEDPDRHRRFLMKRDEPFLVGLAGWDAEPRRAIRVGVE